MWIPADVVAGLGELERLSGLAEGTLSAELADLIDAVLAALPTATGVVLTVGGQGQSVTVRTESFESGPYEMAIPLTTEGAVLTISTSTRVSLGEHPAGPPIVLDASSDGESGPTQSTLADQLSDASIVNRALGILLGQGYHGDLAGIELRRLARRGRQTIVEAAQTLLDSLPTGG